jgi:biotin operon repressor
MKKLIIILYFLISCSGLSGGGKFAQAANDFQEAEKILDSKGQMQEGAWVVRFPRTDIKVTIAGEPMPTALGFGGWAAFKDMGKHTMVMGDLVLLEKEVNPVISTLEENGLQVTALHNHFFWEEPRIMFMHIGGMGSLTSLATGLRLALDKTDTPKGAAASAPAPPLAMDTKRLEQIIGYPGQAMGGVFKITLGRKGVKMAGVEVTSSMGLNSWAGFAGTDEKAHVAGDIVMTAKEVNPVIQALRKGGIDVVAVHNHMIDEQPRVFFLHYWGTGLAESLAQTVRVAFDLVKGPVH